MSNNQQSPTSSNDGQSTEQFGLTGVTTGSSGEHLSTTGGSALGTSGASGDVGNEKSKIDRATYGVGLSSTITGSSPTLASDQGTR